MEVKPANFKFTGNELVVKDLAFLQSAYFLDIAELRLVAMAIIVLRRNGDRAEFDPNQPVTLHANMYADLFNTTKQNSYQVLENASKSLHERRINWVDTYESAEDANPEDDTPKRGRKKKMVKADRLNDLRWTSQCSYISNLGMVQLYFSPQIIPFLVHLDRNFAGYEIRNLIKLTTPYEIRIYELGVAWKAVGVATFKKEALRFKLGILDDNHFKTASNFGRMLNNSLKTINNETDLNISFAPVYAANIGSKGRHVSAYTMTVKAKKSQYLAASSKPALKGIENEPKIGSVEKENEDFLAGLGSNDGLKFNFSNSQSADYPAQAPVQHDIFSENLEPAKASKSNKRPSGIVKDNNIIRCWPNEDGSWNYEGIIKYLSNSNFQIVGMDEDNVPDELLRMTQEYKIYSQRDENLGLQIAKSVISQKIAKSLRPGTGVAASALNDDTRSVKTHKREYLTSEEVKTVLQSRAFVMRYAPHGENDTVKATAYLKSQLENDPQKFPDLEDYLSFRTG